jgi:acyl-coenzyme A thioesterase PaaI-like protein
MEDLTEQRRRELLRIVDGLRDAVDASIRVSAPLEELTALADQAQALARSLEARRGERLVPRYVAPFDTADPNALISFSPVTGRYSPLAPPVEVRVVPGDPPHAVGEVTFGELFEGPPSSVHGSVIAAVYDQMLAYGCIVADCGGPTATLEVRFRKLTPLHVPLRFEAWVDRVDGRKVFVRGTCHAGDDLVTESEGMFVRFVRP